MRARLTRLPSWIDRLWPWGPIVLVALAVLTGLNSIAKRPPPSDTDRIADVLHDFGKAAADQRGEDACALLTARARRELVAEVPTVTCPVLVRSFSLGFDAPALGEASILAITVRGDRGRIRRADLRNGAGISLGVDFAFRKVGADWRIDGIRRG